MDFQTKLAQTRVYSTTNQLGVDSQEVYNEGILQALDTQVEKTVQVFDKLTEIELNQDTQITEATTTNGYLQNIDNNVFNISNDMFLFTNGGILVDILEYQVLTNTYVSLNDIICKYVTLYNLSTNIAFQYRLNVAIPYDMILEPGYSVRINVANPSTIQIRETTGLGQTAHIIITQ